MPPHVGPVKIQVVNEGWHAEEKKHREEEKQYWRKSRRYSVLTIIIAGLAFGAAAGAYWQSQRQANAAAEGNRPWLEVKDAQILRAGIERENNYAYVTFSVAYRNIGHSPAHRIFARAEIRSKSLDSYTLFDLPKHVCLLLTMPDQEFLGNFIFPEKDGAITGSARRDLAEMKSSFEKAEVRYSGAMNWEEFSAKAGFEIYGCLMYEDNEGVLRRTAFIIQASTIDISSGGSARQKVTGEYSDGAYAD